MTTTSWGPVTVTAVGPLGAPSNNVTMQDTGMLAAQILNATCSITATLHTSTAFSTAWDIYFYWYNSSNTLISSSNLGTQHFNRATAGTFTVTAPLGTFRMVFQFSSALVSSDTAVAQGSGSWSDASPAAYCQYGTQLIPGIGGNIILTSGALNEMLLPFGAAGESLAVMLDTFVGWALNTNALCSGQPPALPAFTQDDWLGGVAGIPTPTSIPKWWQGLQAIAWPYFCQCVPGSPSPVSYPAPVISLPPNPPQPIPGIICDGTDLCTILNQLNRQLLTMNSSMQALRNDVTLIQRVRVPFAYVPGINHVGLSGQGTITVPSLVGVVVQLSTVPPWLSSDMAEPPSSYKFGTISFGTPDGWERREWVTHNPHLYLDVNPAVTVIGYTLAEGVIANILELIREA